MIEDRATTTEFDRKNLDILCKKRVIEIAKSVGALAGSFYLSKIAYDVQENVYGRFNSRKELSEFLRNPDYLTSLVYPLVLLFTIRTFLQTTLLLNEQTGQRPGSFILEINKFLLSWAPVFVLALNLWHELSSRPSYQDNLFVDLVAGALSVGTYWAYDWTKNAREKKKNIDKST